MSWLTPHLAPNRLVDELIGEIGALLAGNRTFRGDDPHRGTDSEGKDKYVNVLGADVARQCLRSGLLDEILTLVAPVLLGGGTPLSVTAPGPRSG